MHTFKFWGSATIGTKGQFVIPAEARQQLGFNEGDKVLIMSTPDGQGIVAIKPEVLKEFTQQITSNIQSALKDTKEDEEEQNV